MELTNRLACLSSSTEKHVVVYLNRRLLPKEFIACFQENIEDNEERRSSAWDGPILPDDAGAEKPE